MIATTATYLRHFGMRVDPFSLAPDPDLLYRSPSHDEALAALRLGVSDRNGITVLTGEVGTGKTMLAYALLRSLGDDTVSSYVSNTGTGFDGMMSLVLGDFGAPSAGPSRVAHLAALNAMLTRCAESDRLAVLIVDEAQNLDAECFEQLRLLTNFETFSHKLLQIVLIGQPELETKLQTPELRALADRVAVHCRLLPLGWDQSCAYLDHRLLHAGASNRVFHVDARDLILRAAQGVPRRINMLCRQAMMFAYGRREKQVAKATAAAAIAARAVLMGIAPTPTAVAVDPPPPRRRRAVMAAAGLLAVGVATGLWTNRDGRSATGVAAVPLTGVPLAAVVNAAPAAAIVPAPPSDVAGQEGAAAAVGATGAVGTDDRVDAPAPAVAPEPLAAAAATGIAPPPSSEPETNDAIDLTAAAQEPGPRQAAAATSSGERHVRVEPGQTLEALARSVYGVVDADILGRIQAANPRLVNRDRILAGDVLYFPDRHVADDHNALGQGDHP